MASDNSGSVKGIGVILTIIALITGVASIVTPMKDRISSIEKNETTLEDRLDQKLKNLDDKLQIKINNVEKVCDKNYNIVIKNIDENARLDERVKNIINHISKLEEECKKIQEEILNLHKEGVKK